jgi:hypothetical protein
VRVLLSYWEFCKTLKWILLINDRKILNNNFEIKFSSKLLKKSSSIYVLLLLQNMTDKTNKLWVSVVCLAENNRRIIWSNMIVKILIMALRLFFSMLINKSSSIYVLLLLQNMTDKTNKLWVSVLCLAENNRRIIWSDMIVKILIMALRLSFSMLINKSSSIYVLLLLQNMTDKTNKLWVSVLCLAENNKRIIWSNMTVKSIVITLKLNFCNLLQAA